MVPKVAVEMVPCPDPECVDGKIQVYNAYSEDPFVPQEQTCDICGGKAYVVRTQKPHNED